MRAAPPPRSPTSAVEIGRLLQRRWRETGRDPGVLIADNGDAIVVCADRIRSRIRGVWQDGNFFTAAQMKAMHRPATRLEWLRLLNEALRMTRDQLRGWGDDLARSANSALQELPHGIVRRAGNGDMYVRTFRFAASFVHGRWYIDNRFTFGQRQAMTYVQDRAEREMIITIARAALGVPRTDATFV